MIRPAPPLILELLPTMLWAQDNTPSSVSFAHHDWSLACDNTRTCRAAGYQSDDEQLPVSVLHTRKAGLQQPVTARLKPASSLEEINKNLPHTINRFFTQNHKNTTSHKKDHTQPTKIILLRITTDN